MLIAPQDSREHTALGRFNSCRPSLGGKAIPSPSLNLDRFLPMSIESDSISRFNDQGTISTRSASSLEGEYRTDFFTGGPLFPTFLR
jgi:hypothetical protein